MLQAIVALFIVFAPTFLGMFGIKAAVYIGFFIFWCLTAIRLKTTGKIYYSAYSILLLLTQAYAVISSIWASNKEGQLIFIFAIGCILGIYAVLTDYFTENTVESVRRRIMYMLTVSGLACAVLNIIYWLVKIVPFASKEKLSFGLGTNNYLALFMLFCIISSFYLMKGNSKAKIKLLAAMSLPMIAVFVMANSRIAYIFALFILVTFLFTTKFKKAFSSAGIFGVAVFAGILLLMVINGERGQLLNDILRASSQNLFGMGGGFQTGEATYATQTYKENISIGLLPFLFASSGVFGVIVMLSVIARNVMLFFKLKTWESLIALYVTVIIAFLPFDMSFTVLLLWSGLAIYNECAAGLAIKFELKKEQIQHYVFLISVLVVISALLLVQVCIRKNAETKFENKDYYNAAQLYKTASFINIADSESCYMYAKALRMEKKGLFDSTSALHSIEKAIKRDSRNIENVVEKAEIYYAAGNYAAAAQQYRIVCGYALVKDKYSLALSKVLREIAKDHPVGSSETKRAYEELLELAALTDNLDVRKEINDIADEVQMFTKGELVSER